MKKGITKLITLCIIAILGNSFVLNAQQKTTSPVVRCDSPIPDAQWEVWMQEKVNQLNQQRIIQGNNSTQVVNYTIPVIFHILHNQASVTLENISATQIATQMTVLNNDYAGTNADVSSIPATFSTVKAGNTGVQFCLAKVGPTGTVLTEAGIERINWSTRGWTDPNSFTTSAALQTYFDGTVKPASIWDPTKYLNIWVAKVNGSGLLGYASFPAGTGLTGLTGVETATTCGVVLNQSAVGTSGTAAAPYNGGRTATHEIGHWLGLRHIWGDGACATDFCNDTPPANTSNFNCQTHPYNVGVCAGNTTGEMFMNYMDYVPDNCMYMFTLDQTTRIQTSMANGTYRLPLSSSTKCNNPVSLDAGIASIINPATGMSTCLNSITPQVVLTNGGTTTLTSATITYNVDGGTNQVLSWTGSLIGGGTATLTLNAFTGLSASAHTFSVTASSPNGGVDGFAANNSQTSTFTIVSTPAGAALPFTETFDAATFVPTGWNYTPINPPTNQWTRLANTTGLTAGSTGVAKMDNFSGTTSIVGQRDALRSPALSFATANSSLKLKFDVSHRIYSATATDSLNVWISTDCGGTWTKIYNKGGATLASVTGVLTTAYTPTANNQWRRDSISLAAYAGQPSVYLKFESVSGWGNNLYLDNINVAFTAVSSGPPVANFTSSATKCAGTAIAFTDASTNIPTSWAWTSTPTTGVTIASANTQNPNITFATAGTYTVSLVSTNASGSSPAFTQVVTVNAAPAMTSATTSTVCSGAAVSIPLTSDLTSTYSWIAANNANTTGESITAQATSTINNTLTNTTALTQTVTYSVTPTAGGCAGAVQTVSVSVIPAPTMTSAATASVCSGTPLAIALTSNIPSSYSWIAANNANTTGESLTAQTTGTINNTIINSTATPKTVTYSITPTSTAGSCAGTAQVVSVTVNVLPTVTATSAPVSGTVCSGASVTLTGGGANTYSWTGGVTNATAFTATATTTYTVTGTTTATGCSNTTTQVITVTPGPIMTSATTANVCSGAAVSVPLTSDITATYSWIAANNANTTGESITAQTTSTINNTLTNTTALTQTVTYSVTPTAGGCAGAVQTVSVSVIPAPTMTSAATASVCSGTPLAIALTSNIPSSYSWIAANNANTTGESLTAQTTGTINNTIINSTATPKTVTYSITPTSTAGSCAGTTQVVSVTVNVLPTVTATSAPVSGTVCSGASVTLTGGGANTYSWTGGVTNATAFTATATTTYTVTGTTTATGCSNTTTKTITVNNAPVMTSATTANVCSGAAVSVPLTSDITATYSWIAANNANTTGESITAQATSTINNTLTNTTALTQTVTYSVTPTAGGCAGAVQTVSVSVIPAPTMTSAATASVCSGTPLAIALTSNIPSSYSWIAANNANTTGESLTAQTTGTINNTIINSTATPKTVTYSITPTSTAGSCAGATQVVSVTVNVLPTVTATSTPVSGTVCSGASVTLTGGGANTYTWTGGVTNATAFTATATTTYTVTGTTTTTGCSNTTTKTITVNSLPTITATASPISATVCAGTQVTLTGGGATTYTWSGGVTNATAFTPSSSLTYTVTGTDANGCTSTSTKSVTVNVLPSVIVNSPSTCAGAPTTLTGNGASTYSWSTGETTASISVTTATNTSYTVTGTDANGCVNTAISNVTISAVAPVISFNSSSVCSGVTTTLTASGANTFAWSTGDNTASINVTLTSPTSYTVTGSNGPGCSSTSTVSIGVNPLPTVSAISNPSSGIVCTGSQLTLTGSGANTYTWSGGAIDGVAFAPAGSATYTVTGTDINGCTNTATQSVTVNLLPTVTVNSPSTCSGVSTTLAANGASTFAWSNSLTGSSISVSPTVDATYTVTGTDANGCVNTAVSNVTITAAPNVTVNSQTICAGQSTTLTGNGATSFTWNTGDITAAITVNPTGTASYTVTGSNGAGCQNTAVATVTVNNLPVIGTTSSASSTICSGSGVTLTATGATSYSWNTGDVTDIISVNPAATATYTATGTDANGCSNTSNITVNVFPVNTPTVSQTGNTLTASGATSYQWYLDGNLLPGETNSTITATQNGSYTVVTTDVNGCSATSAGVVVNGIGIKEVANTIATNIYPNPTIGAFALEISLDSKNDYTIEISDVLGRVITSEKVITSRTFSKNYDFSNEANGVYFITIQGTDKSKTVKRIVLNK